MAQWLAQDIIQSMVEKRAIRNKNRLTRRGSWRAPTFSPDGRDSPLFGLSRPMIGLNAVADIYVILTLNGGAAHGTHKDPRAHRSQRISRPDGRDFSSRSGKEGAAPTFHAVQTALGAFAMSQRGAQSSAYPALSDAGTLARQRPAADLTDPLVATSPVCGRADQALLTDVNGRHFLTV